MRIELDNREKQLIHEYWYHRMLTVWRETPPAMRVKSVIEYWLEVLNEIEVNSKEVLNSLVSGH